MADVKAIARSPEDVADRLLRLPFYHALTRAEQDAVIAGLFSFDGFGA